MTATDAPRTTLDSTRFNRALRSTISAPLRTPTDEKYIESARSKANRRVPQTIHPGPASAATTKATHHTHETRIVAGPNPMRRPYRAAALQGPKRCP